MASDWHEYDEIQRRAERNAADAAEKIMRRRRGVSRWMLRRARKAFLWVAEQARRGKYGDFD